MPDSFTSLIVPVEHLNKTKHEAGRTTVVYLGSTEHLETFTLMNCHPRPQRHFKGYRTGSARLVLWAQDKKTTWKWVRDARARQGVCVPWRPGLRLTYG